ncbi:ribonuclease HII [Virgibacillus sp. NKC19-3]|uniref:ribonuclease HII n=1 Tax=Virgibacillus saliphilus TaxID=2831674 RepID=UPI001C9AE270|nr:ribonuclease HII [Virgibacillus sp. NKC19-3]MBY7143651.1 ribonuclease HII [Virgibacillus sp. NKC19-3]
MENRSIAVLKKLFDSGALHEDCITQLKTDDRKGVQQLIKTYEKKKRKEEIAEKKFMEMSIFEQRAYANGYEYIAGIDEAGRGPLAGPVVAAAVILPRDFKLLGLNDSKKLSEQTRNYFFHVIKEHAISYGVSVIDSKKIDEINIFEATKLAMHEAINQLNPKPNHILIDAVNLKGLPCTSEAITKGDGKSVSIAAASILAKVSRDRIMKKIHQEYPAYGFESNMGYGTKHHLDNLMTSGVTPYHRKSFSPVQHATYR